MRRAAFTLSLALTLLAPPARSQAPIRVAGLRPRPQATLGDTITITATPSTVNFALAPGGVTTGSAPVSIVTTWTGISLLSNLYLYASFGSSTAALSGGTPVINNIPSTHVFGSDPSGGIVNSMTAFTGTNPVNGSTASLLLYQLNTFLSLGGTHTDTLSLQIDLTTQPQLPAATYTGTLTLVAEAF
jgi:hypothetical protein